MLYTALLQRVKSSCKWIHIIRRFKNVAKVIIVQNAKNKNDMLSENFVQSTILQPHLVEKFCTYLQFHNFRVFNVISFRISYIALYATDTGGRRRRWDGATIASVATVNAWCHCAMQPQCDVAAISHHYSRLTDRGSRHFTDWRVAFINSPSARLRRRYIVRSNG